MFLGCHVPAEGQTPMPQAVLAQGNGAPILTLHPTASVPLRAPFSLLTQNPGKSPSRFSLLAAGTYERDPTLEQLSSMDEVKTLTLTQSSLALVQLWGGKLKLEAFQSTLHMQNTQLGPLGYGGMEGFAPSRQSYPGGPLSVHFSGLSLSFHFGRDSRTGRCVEPWRRLSRIVGAALN